MVWVAFLIYSIAQRYPSLFVFNGKLLWYHRIELIGIDKAL